MLSILSQMLDFHVLHGSLELLMSLQVTLILIESFFLLVLYTEILE